MQRITRISDTPHPTPAEIREMCLLIQHEWSERERSARMAGSQQAADLLRHWTVHQVRVAPWK